MFNIIFFGQDQEHYDLPSTLLGKSEVINVLNCKEAEELYTLYKSNEIHHILMEVRQNAEQRKHLVQSLQALRIIDSPIILFNVANLLEYHDLYDCGVLQILPKSLPKELLNSIIRTHLKYTNIKLQYSLSKAISSNDDISQNEMQFTKSFFALIQENLFNSQLNVNLLADSLGFSRRQLLRKCYQIFGKTAFEVLDDTRLRLIHDMVQQHNISIRTIAENVGYNSPYYLEKKYAEFLEQLDQDDSH
ncbi:MAG: hypothetical protein CBE44_01520 [Bacteroidetes bacterium TMED284]|nr:hypothetical protein [Balneola sp.]OUX48319.1 MAG: hypothetical protein CBE44_01520 [Bacteroidetes bacterium TMED284]